MPDKWNQKKQFQFDALVSLEHEVVALEAATGISAGYRRTGRLVPLLTEHHREEPLAIHAVYPHRRHLLPKVRSFVDFLAARFARQQDWQLPD